MKNQHPICYELKIKVTNETKSKVIESLHRINVTNFIEGEFDCDVEMEFADASTEESLFEKYDQDLPIIIYSEEKKELEQIAKALAKIVDPETILIQPIKNQDWRESWRESFKPIYIESGDCWVIPPWENKETYASRHCMIIDPGMAFGTGQHETTQMCLEILFALEPFESVLDVGCGSGILSIAAAFHGAERVVGCDIDEAIIRIAAENSSQNQVPFCRFTESPAKSIQGSFDVVIINIELGPLMKVFRDSAQKLRRGGTLVVSGVLKQQEQDLDEALEMNGCEKEIQTQKGQWIAVKARKL